MQICKYPTILEFHPGDSCCGLNCVFCYRKGKSYCSARPLIAERRLVNLINEFAELGGRDLFISGGMEPFSQPTNACSAILHGQRAGLRVSVYSNGIAPVLSDKSTRTILALNAHRVRFSIHSIDPGIYRNITRPSDRNASFLRAFDNVLGVMDARPPMAGAKVGIGFIVLNDNVGELIRAGEFWRDTGIDFFDIRCDVIAGIASKIRQAIKRFQSLVDSHHFDPVDVNIGWYTAGKPRFASRCYAPFQKLVLDPFGLVWCCCLQSQPGFRPLWAKVGDVESEPFSQIVARVGKRFPRDHCRSCTPWEATYNLRREPGSRSRPHDIDEVAPEEPAGSALLTRNVAELKS